MLPLEKGVFGGERSVSGEREGLKALTYVVFLPIRLYGADAGDKAV
ncbi:MAG: hypothetical protein FD153_761, partial [Rhodospirillaceae bacterium]